MDSFARINQMQVKRDRARERNRHSVAHKCPVCGENYYQEYKLEPAETPAPERFIETIPAHERDHVDELHHEKRGERTYLYAHR